MSLAGNVVINNPAYGTTAPDNAKEGQTMTATDLDDAVFVYE